MNSYPMTSTTFIRNEIGALEKLGVSIRRYAIRHWAETLVDPLDVAEQKQTHYVLTGNFLGLAVAFAKELFINPHGIYRSLRSWLTLLRKSGGLVRHVAYFMEAIYFRQRAQCDDVNHVHVHFATNGTAVAMLSHLMGGPSYSFTAHGPDEFVDAKRQSFDLKIDHAAFVVAISEYCKNQLLYFSPTDRDKIHVIRCGLLLQNFEPVQNHLANNQTFVCIGRLCRQKGQVLISQAVAALRYEFPGLKVILVGDGESRASIEASILEHGVGDMFELRGWLTNRDVLKVIHESRALLLPSFAEGLPIVIMEAMALMRPVISTFVAGIPELVRPGEHGWLVPAGDVEALVNVMRACLNAPANTLARMGEAACERVRTYHSIDTNVLQLARLLKCLA
jgi:glycosyltransferase involved in cell wall biosynthesis